MTAPSLTSQTGSNWTDFTSGSEVTGTLSWGSGDRILVIAFTEDSATTVSTPTASGLTFVALGSPIAAASSCWVHAFEATAASPSSSAVTATAGTGGTAMRGIHALAFSGCTGFVRTDAATHNSTKTVSVTRTQANSFIATILADWSASGIAGLGWTPAGQTQLQAADLNPQATAFAAYWGDQGATGTT